MPCVSPASSKIVIDPLLTKPQVLLWLYLNACYTDNNGGQRVVLRMDSSRNLLWLVVPNTPGDKYVGQPIASSFVADALAKAQVALNENQRVDYVDGVLIKVDFATFPTLDLARYRSCHPDCTDFSSLVV